MIEQRTRGPGQAQRGQEPAIDTDPPADSPGDAQEEAEHTQDGVDTDRTSQEVVHIHQDAETSRDAGQDA